MSLLYCVEYSGFSDNMGSGIIINEPATFKATSLAAWSALLLPQAL